MKKAHEITARVVRHPATVCHTCGNAPHIEFDVRQQAVANYAGEVQELAEIIYGGITVAPFSEVKERLKEIIAERDALRVALEINP